jgi:hypothetical protein
VRRQFCPFDDARPKELEGTSHRADFVGRRLGNRGVKIAGRDSGHRRDHIVEGPGDRAQHDEGCRQSQENGKGHGNGSDQPRSGNVRLQQGARLRRLVVKFIYEICESCVDRNAVLTRRSKESIADHALVGRTVPA